MLENPNMQFVSHFICFYYEISQHLCPWSVRDTLDSRLFWSGPISTSVKRELRECQRGQHGVPSVKLHWINTFFTHSTAGMSVPLSWLHAFLSCSLYMYAYCPCYRYIVYSKSLWRNSSTLLRSSAAPVCLATVSSSHFNTSSVWRLRL